MENHDHKKLAIEAFNKTWEYIDKDSRTTKETLEMIHLAHASMCHQDLQVQNLIKKYIARCIFYLQCINYQYCSKCKINT